MLIHSEALRKRVNNYNSYSSIYNKNKKCNNKFFLLSLKLLNFFFLKKIFFILLLKNYDILMSNSTPAEENKNENMITKDSEICIDTKFKIDPEDASNIITVNCIKLYGLQIILFVYFIQSLFFGIILFPYYINHPQKLLLYDQQTIILVIIYGIFIFGMINCTEKYCINCFMSVLLVIFLTMFKILFIGLLFEMIDSEYFNYSVEPDVYVYWNVITALFYMSLIIYNYLKKDINFGIYSIIGLCYCIICFFIVFFTHDDKKNSLVFIILAGTEIFY